MLKRMIGASCLNVQIYEEVEADSSATLQAMLVVLLTALATGIGALGAGNINLSQFFAGLIAGLFSWAIWAFITYWLGTTLFRTADTTANWGELARTTGFAQSPGMFRVLAFLPVIGQTIFFAVTLWQLAAMVVAVRQALDYRSTGRALAVVFTGFLIYAVLFIILGGILS